METERTETRSGEKRAFCAEEKEKALPKRGGTLKRRTFGIALLTWIALSLVLDIPAEAHVSRFHAILFNLMESFELFSLKSFLLLPGLYYLFRMIENRCAEIKTGPTVYIPALIFGFFMVAGYSFSLYNGLWEILTVSNGQFFKTAIAFAGYTVLGIYLIRGCFFLLGASQTRNDRRTADHGLKVIPARDARGGKKGAGRGRSLAELFDRFSDSDILQDVNHLMTNDAEVIAENMATPIKMKSEQIYPIDHFGSVMAPFYTTIAQWIGAMFAAVMIRVQIKEREGLENVRLGQRFLGRYRLFMMIGLAQALLVSLGELLYVGIQCIHPLLFILAACVNSVVFTLIVYSFVFAFENVGLAIGVVMMIIQVAGGGGTFPMEVLPPVFRVMYPFMPFHYAMNAMRECIGGMYEGTYIRCLGALILCGLVAAAIGLLLHKPMKKMIEKVEESKRESDVML